jgi:hypothetical protein
MQRLLGDYADLFNARYHRCGHLFQNRFKSTLVDADVYFLELVRYIHLNPVRARLPVTLEQLDCYPFAYLLGRSPGVSLSAVARHLHVSPQAIARAMRRGETVLAIRNITPDEILSD